MARPLNALWGAFLAVALSAVLAPSMAFATEGIESDGTLTSDAPLSVTIPDEGVITLEFTAPDNGMYTFTSDSDCDARGSLYHINGYYLEDDDDGLEVNGDFSLSWWLVAGETVYLEVGSYSDKPESADIAVTFAPATEDDRILVLDEEERAIIQAGQTTDFTFKAPADGYYEFYSDGGTELPAYLFDADESMLDESDDLVYNHIIIALDEGQEVTLSTFLHEETLAAWAFVCVTECDPYNLANAAVWSDNVVVIVDGVAADPALRGSNYYFNTLLTQGVDFEIVGYCAEADYYEALEYGYDPSWESTIPNAEGECMTLLSGINDYSGELVTSFMTVVPALGTLKANTTVQVAERTLYTFSVPSSGYYTFTSEGDGDALLYVYADKTCTELVDYDDDSGDMGNFILSTYLPAGETVYVLAGPYWYSDPFTFEMTCTFDKVFGFTDTPVSAWYVKNNALGYVISNGIMSGYGNGLFKPNKAITRAEVASILYKTAGGYLEEGEECDLVDIAGSSAWYHDAVTWAYLSGITSGYSDGTFKPNKTITRQEMAVMIAQFVESVYGIDYTEASGEILEDVDTLNEAAGWAVEALEWCTEVGIISGMEKPDGTVYLNAKGNATRAQAASMLMNLENALMNYGGSGEYALARKA